jgi:nucleoside phosphorylase
MVGIAGGIPSPLKKNDRDSKLVQEHVRLGDIFVSEQPVLQYDYVHRGGQEVTNRSTPVSISPRIQLAVQSLRQEELKRNYPWELVIDRATAKLGSDWNRPLAKFDAPSLYGRDGNGNVVPVGPLHHPTNQPRRRTGKPMVHYGRIGSANLLLADAIERERIRLELGVRAVEMEGSGLADAAWSFGVGYAIVRGICDYCDAGKDNRWQWHASICAGSYARQLVNELISATGRRVAPRIAAAPAAKRRSR